MQKFKTEMHCHTMESSLHCGKIHAKDIVNAYIDAGYSTLVITDHYGFKDQRENGSLNDVNTFLKGFYAAKEAANGKINILMGMEINLIDSYNDYLIYGITEDFIKENPQMFNMGIEDFSKFVHEHNLLIYQAHPFRDRMTIVYPPFLDGIEAFNAHPRHDSRNSIAKEWAKLYNLPTISGSDAHQPPDLARGGIITDTEIKTMDELTNILRNKKFELITI